MHWLIVVIELMEMLNCNIIGYFLGGMIDNFIRLHSWLNIPESNRFYCQTPSGVHLYVNDTIDSSFVRSCLSLFGPVNLGCMVTGSILGYICNRMVQFIVRRVIRLLFQRLELLICINCGIELIIEDEETGEKAMDANADDGKTVDTLYHDDLKESHFPTVSTSYLHPSHHTESSSDHSLHIITYSPLSRSVTTNDHKFMDLEAADIRSPSLSHCKEVNNCDDDISCVSSVHLKEPKETFFPSMTVIFNLPQLMSSPSKWFHSNQSMNLDDETHVDYEIRSDVSIASMTVDYNNHSYNNGTMPMTVTEDGVTARSSDGDGISQQKEDHLTSLDKRVVDDVGLSTTKGRSNNQLPRHVLNNTLHRNDVMRGCQGFLFDSSSSALRLVANVEPLTDNFVLGCFLSGIIDGLNYLGNFYLFQKCWFHGNEQVIVSIQEIHSPWKSLKEFMMLDVLTAICQGFVCGTLRFYHSLWLASGSVQITGVIVKIALSFLWSCTSN